MCICAVEVTEHLGIGLELRREGCAEAGQCGCEVGIVRVRGFVVDDPPDGGTFREWCGSGAEHTVDLHGAERAGEDADPAGFCCIVRVGRQDPLPVWLGGGGESETERFYCEVGGLGWGKAGGADFGGEARLELLERGAGLGPVAGLAEAGQVLKVSVNCGAKGAGDQSAFVSGVKIGI